MGIPPWAHQPVTLDVRAADRRRAPRSCRGARDPNRPRLALGGTIRSSRATTTSHSNESTPHRAATTSFASRCAPLVPAARSAATYFDQNAFAPSCPSRACESRPHSTRRPGPHLAHAYDRAGTSPMSCQCFMRAARSLRAIRHRAAHARSLITSAAPRQRHQRARLSRPCACRIGWP